VTALHEVAVRGGALDRAAKLAGTCSHLALIEAAARVSLAERVGELS
jgi:hypothetical protein